jgi:protein gp37
MSGKTTIEWTDATWNPIRGCSRVSEGCRNCYAERVAARFSGPGQPYEGLAIMMQPVGGAAHPHWTGKVRLIEDAVNAPLHWRTPRRVFVNSMADLFHEKVPDQWIDRIFAVMAMRSRHTFQVLTKRPDRMRAYMEKALLAGVPSPSGESFNIQRIGGAIWMVAPQVRTKLKNSWPIPNVWLGVSVEDQAAANERIPLLLHTPAAVRFVSYEPALGPVDFTAIRRTGGDGIIRPCNACVLLDWIICGGESGPGARPMHPDWARVVRNQCAAAGVPFFFKQWGEWLHVSQMEHAFTKAQMDSLSLKTVCRDSGRDDLYFRVGKRRAGRLLDGRKYDEFPTPHPIAARQLEIPTEENTEC